MLKTKIQELQSIIQVRAGAARSARGAPLAVSWDHRELTPSSLGHLGSSSVGRGDRTTHFRHHVRGNACDVVSLAGTISR